MTEEQVLSTLSLLESEGLVRTVNPIGDWYRIYCPIHSEGKEKKASCGVALHDIYMEGKLRYPAGFFHCFTCGFSRSMPDGISDILKSHNITRSGFEWLKENIPGFEGDANFDYLIPSEVSQAIYSRYAINYMLGVLEDSHPKYITEAELASYRLTVPYMYERRLTDDIIAKYDVGYDANFIPEGRKKPVPCITFPLHDMQGNTVGFCRRSIKGKYFYITKGIKKPVYGMYELPDKVDSLLICESCFNALTAVSYGYNAVALLGTGTPEELLQLQRSGIREFVICLDNDEAGLRGAARLKKALKTVGIVWTMTIPPLEVSDPTTHQVTYVARDVNDLTKAEFDYYYALKQ